MGFSFGIIEINGEKVVVDAFSAMIYNAEKSGNTRLLGILNHRREVHDDGPCQCEKITS